MKMNKNIIDKNRKSKFSRLPKKYISTDWKNILYVVGVSFVLLFMGTFIFSAFSSKVMLLYLMQPSLFLLNTLPLTLVMLCIFFLTSRIWVSYLVSGSLYLIIQMINYFKIGLRHEPFVPADIFLGNESTKVININELPVDTGLIVLMILFLVSAVVLFLTIKSKPIRWYYRALGIAVSVLLSITLFNTVYKNEKFYNRYKVEGTIYSPVDIVRSRGFMYSFLVKTNSLKLKVPEGYQVQEVEEFLEKYENEETVEVSSNISSKDKLPHIIAVMSEAFFDIDRIPGIEFYDYNNPLKNYNKIIGEAYHGKIVTGVYGGGTASTECEFLTGTCLSIPNWCLEIYSLFIRKDTFSLARLLKDEGYKTTSLHPGFKWFYNRFNVYDYFGFDKRFFADDITERETNTLTGYISDMDTYKFLLKDFKKHLEDNPENPYFNFTVTIENHGPYPNEPIGYPEILKHNGSVDEEYYHLINNYLGGLKQNDEALGYLVEQLEESDEPVILIYFGDHLPFLGNDFAGYKAMKYSVGTSYGIDEYLNTYETPYFIWSNSSAKALFKKQGKELPVGEAPKISPNYLGPVLLDYVGLNHSAYFKFLSDIKDELPVITKRFYKNGEGNFTESLTPDEKAILNRYSNLQYYMLFDYKVN